MAHLQKLTSGMSSCGMRIKGLEHQHFVGLLILEIIPLVSLIPEYIIRFSDYMGVDVV